MKTVIQFKDQADAIEQLCMKVFGAKPEYLERVAPTNGFHYFRDNGDCVWKMPFEGAGFVRFRGESTWHRAACTLANKTGDPEIREISAEEGEP